MAYFPPVSSALFSPRVDSNAQAAALQEIPVCVEQQIVTIKEEWERDLERVPPNQRELYKAAIGSKVDLLRKRARTLRASGWFPQEVQAEMKRMAQEFKTSLESFYLAKAACVEGKEREHKVNETFAARLGHLSLPSLACAQPAHSSDEHDSELSSTLSQWANGKTAHHIGHRFGKTKGHVTELGLHLTFAPIPEESQSPWRDRIISTAAHVGISETVALFLPGGLQAYTVTLGVGVMAEVGKSGEKGLKNLTHQERVADVEESWNRQWLLSGQEGLSFHSAMNAAELMAQGMQAPLEFLHSLHHEVTEAVAKIGNEIGLTDESVARAAERAFQWLKEVDYEILEQSIHF